MTDSSKPEFIWRQSVKLGTTEYVIKSVEEIILEHTKEYDYPICFGFPAGHINDNQCIKLGVKSVLKITENVCVHCFLYFGNLKQPEAA